MNQPRVDPNGQKIMVLPSADVAKPTFIVITNISVKQPRLSADDYTLMSLPCFAREIVYF
jgi:hypothetical protein